MTVLQIRGTSGSGKSTVMRRVMDYLDAQGGRQDCYVVGRKKPAYYRYNNRLFVLGHYESACGGCDTIGSAAKVFELINQLKSSEGGARIIICEGLLLSEDVKWSSQLDHLRVVFLTTPVEKCIEQIKGRRAEAGNEKPLNTTNTTKRVDVIERARVRLVEVGVTCRRAPFDQAVKIILDWIKNAD